MSTKLDLCELRLNPRLYYNTQNDRLTLKKIQFLSLSLFLSFIPNFNFPLVQRAIEI